MSDTIMTMADLEAMEKARWTPTEETKVEPTVEPTVEPKAADDASEPVAEASDDVAADTTEEPDADDKDARVRKAYFQMREARRLAEALRKENEVLKGQRTEAPDEAILREAEILADRKAKAASFARETELIAKAGEKTYKDFTKAVGDLAETLNATADPNGFNSFTEAVMEAGENDSHKVFYWLGKNPDEAERIAGLSPSRQGAALAKIAAKVTAPPAPKLSKAPAPINPLGTPSTSAGVATSKDVSKMSMAEFHRHEMALEAAKRKARFGG